MNLISALPGREALTGLSSKRSLPKWHRQTFVDRQRVVSGGREVVLLVDTFSRYFEPENARAAITVLEAAGYRVHVAKPAGAHARPLCCGRTFLAAGLVNEAKREAQRMLDALEPFVNAGLPILGLEPSCLFTLRDEFESMLPGEATKALAKQAMLFEEFLAREADAGRLNLKLKPVGKKALLHGHCHQKAFATMGAVERALRLVPELEVTTVESSCCGMAGSFGYEAEHYEVSMKMAEASLLPAVRKADDATLIVADGTSCRHQIAEGAHRNALHVARVLAQALA
jgi:Fe-S oxidoreductase